MKVFKVFVFAISLGCAGSASATVWNVGDLTTYTQDNWGSTNLTEALLRKDTAKGDSNGDVGIASIWSVLYLFMVVGAFVTQNEPSAIFILLAAILGGWGVFGWSRKEKTDHAIKTRAAHMLAPRRQRSAVWRKVALALSMLTVAVGCVSAPNNASAFYYLDLVTNVGEGVSGDYSVGNTHDVNQALALEFTAIICCGPGIAPIHVSNVYIDAPNAFHFTLGLMADSGGLPSGQFIPGESIHVPIVVCGTSVCSDSNGVNFNNLDWPLTLGSNYWLVAVADRFTADVIWNTTTANPFDIPPLALAYTSDGTGFTGWQAFSGDFPIAQVTAYVSETRDFPDTPLPAALPLFATGLGGFGLLSWRRKKKAVALGA